MPSSTCHFNFSMSKLSTLSYGGDVVWGLFWVVAWGVSLGGDFMSCMGLLVLLLLYMVMCGCVLLSFLFNLWLDDLFV